VLVRMLPGSVVVVMVTVPGTVLPGEYWLTFGFCGMKLPESCVHCYGAC
jgi:hypothetical protein